MMSTRIRKLVTRCTALRSAKDAIGREIDQLDDERTVTPLSDDDSARYDAIYVEYGRLFDEIADLQDAILAAPTKSRCDVIAKLAILEDRAKLEADMAGPIAQLADQVSQWRLTEPVIWP
jgi:hypothetical protein